MRHALLVLLAGFALAGCDVPMEVDEIVSLQLRSQSEPCGAQEQRVDLGQDPTFKQYRSHIQKIELESAELEIADPHATPDSAASQLNGVLAIAPDRGAPPVELGHFSHVAVTAGNRVALTLDPHAQSRLSQLLLDPPNEVLFSVKGCADHAPVGVDARVHLKLRITANPID